MWHTLSLIFTVTGLVSMVLFMTEHFNDRMHNRTRWSDLTLYQWTLAAGIMVVFPVGLIVIPVISYLTK